MSFALERRVDGERLLLSLSGTIDEHADLSALAAIDRDTDIDLAGVRRINSFGIREWMRALRASAGCHRLRLFRCPPVLIDQANMVHGFFDRGMVESFYVPMVCPECERSDRALIERRRFEAEGMPEVSCEGCRAPLEIDEWGEHYFGFLG